MITRGKVEEYGTGKVTHYHVIIYPQTKTELGLVEGQTYHLRFTQDNMFFFWEGDLILRPFPPNAWHFPLLKNVHIRTNLLKVGQWYDVAIHPVLAGPNNAIRVLNVFQKLNGVAK